MLEKLSQQLKSLIFKDFITITQPEVDEFNLDFKIFCKLFLNQLKDGQETFEI